MEAAYLPPLSYALWFILLLSKNQSVCAKMTLHINNVLFKWVSCTIEQEKANVSFIRNQFLYKKWKKMSGTQTGKLSPICIELIYIRDMYNI